LGEGKRKIVLLHILLISADEDVETEGSEEYQQNFGG